MALTAEKLIKALKKVPKDTPIYIADHDHGTYETNSIVNSVYLLDQQNPGYGKLEQVKNLDPIFKIEGPYVVIRP